MDAKLPATWTASTLGAVAHGFLSGGTPSTKNEAFWRGSVPWITSKWINSRLYLDSGEKFISDDAVRHSATTVVPRNNLIFATRVGVGKVAVNHLDLAINQDLAGVLIDSNRYDIRFIAYQLRSERLQNVVASHKRGATIQGITRDNLKELEINLPPLPEQRKIAGVLGVVQRAMEQQERLLALTAELKKALLHQLFTAGLRGEPQKQTEIGPVPDSWEVAELISAVEQIDYGISAPIPKTPPENGVKIVSTADITKDGRLVYEKIRRIVAPEKTVKRLTLQTGDVLFNWRNSAELIGKSAVFQEQEEPHVFASFILRIKCGEKKSHNFLLANLMNYFRETSVFLKLARRAVNQANYNRNEISVLKIPLPAYQEQREIADVIGAVDTKIHHHRQKKSKFEDLFRTLLHQLMTAQIRVHDLDLPELAAHAQET
jgi:type I restriction enzyme S subunit